MFANEKKHLKRKVFAVLLCITLIFAVIIAFASIKNLHNWESVYDFFNISSKVDNTVDFLRVMDVGQGDAVLICSNGDTALIDTGTSDSADALCSDIYSIGIRELDLVMLSHFHSDHSGGIDILAGRFSVLNLLLPDIIKSNSDSGYPTFSVEKVRNAKGEIRVPIQGMSIILGDFEMTVLGYYSDMSNENSRSIILMAEIDGIRFLLTGDAEADAEKRLLAEGIDLDCDVLKVGHHGSNTSSSEEFLEACKPEYAAISCGEGNPYSHPNKNVLERLDACKAQIYRTDLNGNITFYIENGDIRIETEK